MNFFYLTRRFILFWQGVKVKKICWDRDGPRLNRVIQHTESERVKEFYVLVNIIIPILWLAGVIVLVWSHWPLAAT